MRNALVSAHGLKNELYSCVRACHDVCFQMQIPMVNQSTDSFSICTIGTNGTNRPFVQVSNGLHVLMRCISPMLYQ